MLNTARMLAFRITITVETCDFSYWHLKMALILKRYLSCEVVQVPFHGLFTFGFVVM